jgi:hypothetical protein
VGGPVHVVQILCFWNRKVHNYLSISAPTLCLHLFILECFNYVIPGCHIYDKWLPDTSNLFISPIYWYSIDIQSIITKVHVMSLHTECVNDEMYQLDATIVIYYRKYLYMFQASICPSSGVHVVCYCIWCSALGVVVVVLRSWCVVLCTVCKLVSEGN